MVVNNIKINYMKILEYIPQLGSGGGERFTVDLCNELSKNNEVILCLSYSLDDLGFYRNELSTNIKVISFGKKGKGLSLKIFFKLLKTIIREKPDVVHTHLMSIVYTSLSAVVFRKPKYFHTVHNSAKEESDGKIGALIRRFLFKGKYVTPITISPASNKSFIEYYNMEASMIPNGRDVQTDLQVSKAVFTEVENFRAGTNKIIVQLAHVGAQKRQNLMARVIDRLNKEGFNVCVLMIGEIIDTSMAEEIRELRNDRICLLGGKHNPLEYLKCADAFALSSSYEGLPISLIEALALGAVPVCTPVGGIVDLVENGVNGWLSDDISEDSYYEAVKKFVQMNDNELAFMKVKAIESYQPYSMKECSKRYNDLFSR